MKTNISNSLSGQLINYVFLIINNIFVVFTITIKIIMSLDRTKFIYLRIIIIIIINITKRYYGGFK